MSIRIEKNVEVPERRTVRGGGWSKYNLLDLNPVKMRGTTMVGDCMVVGAKEVNAARAASYRIRRTHKDFSIIIRVIGKEAKIWRLK